jgi:MFS family permease
MTLLPQDADKASRNAALTLALALPGDAVLYLLLPLYAPVFGVTLAQAGVLLAANRLVRIAGYGLVARLYSARGPRAACLVASAGAIVSTLGYFWLSGLWALLVMRLVWGLSFAALNIANQVLPTAAPEGAARRSGKARALVAVGPMVALMGGAIVAELWGPRIVFLLLGLAALAAPLFAARLPHGPEAFKASSRRLGLPGPINVWSFIMGLTLDGLFIFGLSLLAAKSLPHGAVIAGGAAMALRYLVEIGFAPVGGHLAQQHGARRMVVVFSIGAAAGLALLAGNGPVLWTGILVTIVLRALLQPLPGPLVAQTCPHDERIATLASQATWRDIGAGSGPLLAGLLLPVVPALAVYGGSAALLGAATGWLARAPVRRD